MRTVSTGDHRRLSTTGKPARALRALSHTSPTNAMTEQDVWSVAARGSGDTAPWHAALSTLVFRDLAIRTGRRGGFQWYITDVGRELLKEIDES